LPNECWQADFTHWRLTDGTDVEILCWIDDHSRDAISVTAHRRVTGPIVVDTFTNALETHGIPASTLTDNGMVFTTRLSGGKGGRNGYETLLDALHITQKNSRPNHPTTCGKVERFHQTLKRWLAAHPAATIDELQAALDQFVHEYNQQRPHSSLGDRTPIAAYHTRPKASPPPLTNRITASATTASATATSHCASAASCTTSASDAISTSTGEIIRTLTIGTGRRAGAEHARRTTRDTRPRDNTERRIRVRYVAGSRAFSPTATERSAPPRAHP
jgi:hypothetical protein